MIRRGGESLFVYLRQADDDQDLQRRVVAAAHELRNPASVIQGLAGALLAGGADLDEAERSRLLDAIAQQAELLGTVSGDLLVPAQAQHGNLRIEAAPVDPVPILRSEGELLDDVAVEVDDERSVVADARRLEQMVHNLVSNARKHGQPPYTFRVRAAEDPAYVSLDVIDRGPGVPADFRDQMFDEYTRAEGTAVEGVGLGLYVVQVLAQAQGGTVVYADHPDGGAVFTLSLPASE
jgi:signal transduction histidine kinase